MADITVGLEPLIPPWMLGVLCAALLAAVALAAWRARSIAPARLFVVLIAILLLAGPVRRTEEREPSRSVAVALVDRSASMTVGGKAQAAAAALARLREQAPEVDWRVIGVDGGPGGTTIAPAFEQALREVRAEQLAGVVAITDGIVRDAPAASAMPAGRPFHLLLAGDPALADRRLVVEGAPAYTVVGQSAEIRLRIDDGPDAARSSARLDWQVNGQAQAPVRVSTGETVVLRVPVRRRGLAQVAISAEPLRDGEATLVNNRVLVGLSGVRDRLRVLLVSGVPYPGGRVWRDILKADPGIDLVHFTILRLPSSYDPTPGPELALIPFPVEELFERRLDRFDLVILDRFGVTELLSPHYFGRLEAHVRGGGGMLVVSGPEFSRPGSIAQTALRAVLPALPAGPVIEGRYVPALTALGRSHPVTAVLPERWGGEDWGAWSELAPVTPLRGTSVLMTGISGRPLLMLASAGRGRTALLASTQVWWWARGVDGAGPREELLRRLAHWLMQEPDLDAQQLEVTAHGRRLDITARGLEAPGSAVVSRPQGGRWRVALRSGSGTATGSLAVPEDGLYRISAGGLTRFVLAGDAAELSEVRPRQEPLARLARASGGGLWWLKDGMPTAGLVDAAGGTVGDGRLALVRSDGGRLVAIRSEPLLPRWLALLLMSAALGLAWWRERR